MPDRDYRLHTAEDFQDAGSKALATKMRFVDMLPEESETQFAQRRARVQLNIENLFRDRFHTPVFRARCYMDDTRCRSAIVVEVIHGEPRVEWETK